MYRICTLYFRRKIKYLLKYLLAFIFFTLGILYITSFNGDSVATPNWEQYMENIHALKGMHAASTLIFCDRTYDSRFVTLLFKYQYLHFQSKPLMNLYIFATVHLLMKDTDMMRSCQAHLPV